MAHLFNVRGTNGSGKTTLIQQFVKGPWQDFHSYVDKKGKAATAQAHVDAERGIVIIGKYEAGRCGGTDGIKTQDAVRECVAKAARMPGVRIVMFEGLLVSGLFQSYMDFAASMRREGHDYTWAFMRTDLQECYRRVLARSKRENVPIDNVESKYKSVESVRRKVLNAGTEGTVLDLPGHWNDERGEPAAAEIVRAHLRL